MTFRSDMTGTPEPVLATVDGDLLAETRGPAALDRMLADRSSDELRDCYRAVLQRINHDHAMQPRRAAYAFAAAEQRADAQNDRTWSR